MLLFSLDGDTAFANALAARLGVELALHEEIRFPDGELRLRPQRDPRGEAVCVLHGLHGDATFSPQDKLWRTVMFVSTLRDLGARHTTAILPYLAYARQDRRVHPFDTLGLRCVAQALEAGGVQEVLTLEAHNPAAFECAFRVPARSLPAYAAFAGLLERFATEPKVVVASPDLGGLKRARGWRDALQSHFGRDIGFAAVEKRRRDDGVSHAWLAAGDVGNACVLLVDDLIATGGTLQRATGVLRDAGARRVVACAAHGLFSGAATSILADGGPDEIVLCDAVAADRVEPDSALRRRLEAVPCAGLFADALQRGA